MKSSSTKFLSLPFHPMFTLLTLFIYFSAVQAGLRGSLCPDDENGANVTCQEQCRNQHNSLYGKCGTEPGDFNCYCSAPLPGFNSKSIACVDRFDTRYDLICRAGCQCVFNAVTGVCNYQNHACECQGQNQNPRGRGRYCPFKTYIRLARYINAMKAPGFYYPLKRNNKTMSGE